MKPIRFFLLLAFFLVANFSDAQYWYSPPITPTNTSTLNITTSGTLNHTISGDVRVSPTTPNNAMGIVGDGLFVPKGANSTVQNALSEIAVGTYEWGGTLLHSTNITDPTNSYDVNFSIGRMLLNTTTTASTPSAQVRGSKTIGQSNRLDYSTNNSMIVNSAVTGATVIGYSSLVTALSGSGVTSVQGYNSSLNLTGSTVTSARGVNISCFGTPTYYRGVSVTGPTTGTQRMFLYLGTNGADFASGMWGIYCGLPTNLRNYFAGDVWIGTTAGTANLTVNGTAAKVGGGSWSVFSDKRAKQIHDTYSEGIEVLQKIQPYRYSYTPEFIKNSFGDEVPTDSTIQAMADKVYIGVVAQEIEAVKPEWVSSSNSFGYDDFKTVDMSDMVYLLRNAVVQQAEEISTLKSQVEALTALLNK
jgi:hypothetical protein